ncbi:MAG: hypothetical protein KF830_12965 [Planctomycetes bacterium]|nr:hypothetical protein [Planctomycetota bacterium]
MRWRPAVPLLLFVPACGGGGGGGSTPPAALPVRLAAAPLDVGPATTAVDLVVELADATSIAPVLLQVAIELPPALALAPADRLQAIAGVPDLDGETKDGRFVVLCGDARNPAAAPLAKGPLFRLRLVTSTPRQLGVHQIRLRDLRAADSAGTNLAVDPAPALVAVTVR